MEQLDGNNEQKIDAIKEIIFGENIKEYEKEFKKLKDILSKHKEEFRVLLNDTKKDLMDQIKELDKEAHNQLDALKKETTNSINKLEDKKTSREQLADLLIEMGKNLKK